MRKVISTNLEFDVSKVKPARQLQLFSMHSYDITLE
jgi:hypothetical protein